MLGEFHGLSVIDAGCGNGSVSMGFLLDNRVTFLDPSSHMLSETAKAIPPECASRAELIHAGLLDAALERRFDIIVCLGVLAYIEDTGSAIERLAGLLKPGGRCLLQITDADTAFGALMYHYAVRHARLVAPGCTRPTRTTRSQILSSASNCGLNLIAEERYAPTLPGLRRWPRLFARYLAWSRRHRMGSELVMLLTSES
jgi:2-polyprenyl-3-methyl-5-hydroxy-6-metoxy-1,4-benzoquinol methylase